MGDELTRMWEAYGALLAHMTVLEEIADRLAVTCADPVAVADFWKWKAETTPTA